MQQRTLPECNRLYKQQLQQQEQISLEVLDQVQESLSLLQTLYRSRTSFTTNASNGEQANAEAHTELSNEHHQPTETHKTDKELQNERQSTRQQYAQDMSWRAYCRREDKGGQPPYDEQEAVKVSSERHACRLPSDEDSTSAERKTTVLPQPIFKRFSFEEHTVRIQQQRANGCGKEQSNSIEHGKRSHSEARQTYVPTAAPPRVSSGNGGITESANEDTLHVATHESSSISLHSPVAAAIGLSTTACTTPQDAAGAGSSFMLVKGPSCRARNGSEGRSSSDKLRDEQLATHTSTRRDVACTANLPICVSIRDTSPPGYPRVDSASPSSPPLPCKDVERAALEVVSATTACQQRNHISDLLTKAPPPTVANSHATSDEHTSKCKSRWELVTASCRSTPQKGYNFTTVRQKRAESRGDLHEGRFLSSRAAQSKPVWSKNSMREGGSGSAALPAVRASRLGAKNVESPAVQGGDRSLLNQRVDSAAQAPSPKTDASTHSFNSSVEFSITTCLPSESVPMDDVVDNRCTPHRAATSKGAKPPFPPETTAVDAGNRNDTEDDNASFPTTETSAGFAAREVSCTEARREAPAAYTKAVLSCPAYCWEQWDIDTVKCCDNVLKGSTLHSPQTPLQAPERSKIETKTEDIAVDVPVQSDLAHQEDSGSEYQQTGSRSMCRKARRDKNGHLLRTRGEKPLQQTPQKQGMGVAADGTHSWKDSRRQGFPEAFSQHVRSHSGKSVLPSSFHMPFLRHASNSEPHIPHTQHAESPCAFLLHCPCKGYAVVRPSSVAGIDQETTSLSTSPPTPEKQWAAYSPVARVPQVSGAVKGLRPQHSRNHARKDVGSFCVSTAPSSAPSTPALTCPQKRLCVSSVRSPPSEASHPRTSPANDVLTTPCFNSCCYGSQQPVAIGKLRHIRRCCRRISSPFSPHSGRCLGASVASRSPMPPKEVSLRLAEEGGSRNDGTWIFREDIGDAVGKVSLSTGVVRREFREPVTLTAAFCKDAASSRVPHSSLPVGCSICADEEPEPADTSPEAYSSPSVHADCSDPLLVSVAHDTTDISSLGACPSRTPGRLGKPFGPPTCTKASHAAYCRLCFHHLDCSALPESVAHPFLHPNQTAHKFSVREEKAPQTVCACAVQRRHQGKIKEKSSNKSERGKFSSPTRRGTHLWCGAREEVRKCELQVPLTYEVPGFVFRDRNHEQLRVQSPAGKPSDRNMPTAAAQSRVYPTPWGGSNTCSKSATQMKAATTKAVPKSKTSEEALKQSHSGTHRRRWPWASAQPSWSVGFQAQRLRSAPESRASTDVRQSPSSKLNQPIFQRVSTGSATISSDCVASHPDADKYSVRARTPATSQRRYPLYLTEFCIQNHRKQPFKLSVNPVPVQQQLQCQPFHQERSEPLSTLGHYRRILHPRSDPNTKSGIYQEAEESPTCNGTEDVCEEPQGQTHLENMHPSVSAHSCGFACCSAVQQEMGFQQRASPLSNTSEARNVSPFSATGGLLRARTSGYTSHCSSMRRFSTASTHADDAASPEFSPQPSVGIYRNKICMTPPLKGKTKHQLARESCDADVYDSNTSDDISSQRREIISGKHSEHINLRTEKNDSSRQEVEKMMHSPHVQVAAQRRFGLVSHNRSRPAQIITRSPSACPAYYLVSHGEGDDALSREISSDNCQLEVAEASKGVTQTKTSAEEHQRGDFFNEAHNTGDIGSIQNQSHQMRKMLLGFNAEAQPYPANELVPQTPVAKRGYCTNVSNHPKGRRYHPMAALVHSECAPVAVLQATEPAAPLQPSSFILKVAAAEAAAILRNEWQEA